MATNVKITKQISLEEYIKVFNFISKLAYYITNGNTSSLGPLRRECCTELINHDDNLVKIKESITGEYTLKYLEMYSDWINDKVTLSVVLVTTEPEETPKPIQPIIYSTESVFDDDLKRIYALIDYRIFSNNTSIETSCADYMESVLNPVIEEMTGMELVQDEMREFVIKNKFSEEYDKITRLPMRSLNILLSNYLYEDGVKYKDNEPFMNVINITIDKLNGKCIDNSRPYAALNINDKEEIRQIFMDYLDL